MDKCLYNGKPLYSSEVAQLYEKEEEIREASKKLACCDPNCNIPVYYRHGKIRIPHFAHIKSTKTCNYDVYHRKSSKLFKYAKDTLFAYFNNMLRQDEFIVDTDVQIIGEHFTPIVIKGHNIKVAIDILEHHVTANSLSCRHSAYNDKGYLSQYIVIDKANKTNFNERYDAIYPVKFVLNKSINKQVIIMDTYDKCFYAYKFNSDIENNQTRKNVFVLPFSLKELSLVEFGFQIQGLEQKYSEWVESFKQVIYHSGSTDLISQPSSFTKRISNSETKIAQKIADKRQELYRKTGKFVGNKVKGEYTLVDLSEIKLNKQSRVEFAEFTKKDFEEKIKNALQGSESAVRMLIHKLYKSSHLEQQYYVEICKEYSNKKTLDDYNKIMKVLRYIYDKAMNSKTTE